ncbi:MAG: glycosyltransferase family 39 protein [Acidobacteriia bacterium]|nr:glycosyltransferase family 39 protein [Terriglobia bacterium]
MPLPPPAVIPARKQAVSYWLPWSLLAAGMLARLVVAQSVFLNPDEALHYLLSVQPSLALTYRATLTTAHPPLLIVLLHYWSVLGTSEWMLRLPSVLAGTAFCGVMFLWLERVTNRTTALIGLTLLLFSPALIHLSAEIRQYALLQFFAACSLYFLERGVGESSPRMVLCSALALYLALLCHYASFLFALTLGLYALLRIRSAKAPAGVVIAWVAGQLGALAEVGFLLVTHVALLKARGAPQAIADSYLRGSIYHATEDRPLVFVARNSLRFFHYLFSQGAVGTVGLLLFILGVVLLIRDRELGHDEARPTSLLLGLLLAFPLVFNCGAALLGIYPYGGTHHDSYLAGFAMAGIAVALARWTVSNPWVKPLTIAAVLAICNLFPSPTGQYIQAKDQDRKWMSQAAQSLQSLPPGSVIFTDDQGGLLLSYYLCHSLVSQVQRPFQPFQNSPCGRHRIIALSPDEWIFEAKSFPDDLQAVQRAYGLPSGSTVWLFQAGWLIDKEEDLHAVLRQYGAGKPQKFGQNILLWPLLLP